MVVFYQIWKKYNEIQLTKNKMDSNKSNKEKSSIIPRLLYKNELPVQGWERVSKVYRQIRRGRRKLDPKKTIAHDDVTQRATARIRKILKKINGFATQTEFTVNFNATTLKLSEKFDHQFSQFFIFSNIFSQGHGCDAVTVTRSKYNVSLH